MYNCEMSVQTQRPTVDPEVGMVYQDSRGDDRYEVCYADPEVVVLKCETTDSTGTHHHRLEPRAQFMRAVEADRFELCPDVELELATTPEQDWTNVAYIGAQTNGNLHDAGYRTHQDIHEASDKALLAVDGLGQAGLSNLREYVQ